MVAAPAQVEHGFGFALIDRHGEGAPETLELR